MIPPIRAVLVATAIVAAGCSGGDGASGTTSQPTIDDAPAATSDTASEAATDDVAATDDDRSTTSGGSGASAASGGVETPPFQPEPIDWEDFDEQVDVGTVVVPVDYDNPDGDTIELFMARYRALDQDNRIGSLLVNRGGPGFGSSDFAVFASQIFDQSLLERFDIIGWDPRGTGESVPAIDCIDDYDRYYNAIDSTPSSDDERQLLVDTARDFAERCVANNAALIDHVGTNNSARDIDAIRRALDEDTVSYFGFSYGSELGATWATLFPDTVRAAVLDGASDPNADAVESSLQQTAGFDAALSTFLAWCGDDDDCEFHNDGDTDAAFDELFAALDQDPLTVPGDRAPVNRDVATTAVVQAMYSDRYWPALADSLAAAQEGDGTGLLELSDRYYGRRADGTFGNELEAFQVISCADTAERKSVDEVDAESTRFTEVSPRLAPPGSAGGYFCTFLPPAADPRIEIDAAGAGPILVIGTTGDPATPLTSTQRMSDQLEDGRLVIVDADQHNGYGVNRCIVDIVNDYLIDLDAPVDGTTC